MALQYINSVDLADMQYAMAGEDGINVETYSAEYSNERSELKAPAGNIRGFVTNYDPRRITSFNGEIEGSSGLGAITGFNIPVVLANAETYAGIGAAGDNFLDSGATIGLGREAWKTLSGSVTLYEGLTAA